MSPRGHPGSTAAIEGDDAVDRPELDFRKDPPSASIETFPAIGDYALIGDCGSAALVSRDGSIEWLCWPRFDSPSLFASVLDRERGGSFRISPTSPYRTSRRYVSDTAVLEIEFRTDDGVLRLRDCMVAAPGAGEVGALWPEHQLLRELRCLEGRVEFEVCCDLRFDYGRRRVGPEDRGSLGIFLQDRGDVLCLRGELSLEVQDGRVRGRRTLEKGDRCFVLLAYDHGEPAAIPPLGDYSAELLSETVNYWRGWSGRCDYEGPHRDWIVRSAITLKMMACSASGAVVAAPTSSLPEAIGGVRNWDYRFCWLRDACFTLRALFELGYTSEGNAFFAWLLYATYQTRADLRVLYNIFGGEAGPEKTLDHLRGYRDSRPVRTGNAAKQQLQLDVYGELVASAYEYVQREGTLGLWSGRLLARVGDAACRLWRVPDRGIWELRRVGRRHVHSIAMCGLALERLIELGDKGELRLSRRRRARFAREATAIRETIDQRGWSDQLGSFTTELDGHDVDASLLLLGLYGYVEPGDPRMVATFRRIRKDLGCDGLLRRYAHGNEDGLPPGEGAFGICSFWACEYLARLGKIEEAESLLDELCGYANEVGLFAEEIDPESGTSLGNFPQAFSHVGLVSAVLAIAEARGTRPNSRLGERQRRTQPGRVASSKPAEELWLEEGA
jgi:GH15 family glucan-1,4-alpha-glucosidase